MKQTKLDVIVVGAGAAGLMAALELALTGKKVAVVEAKEKSEGRINTITAGGQAFEAGAEFVHGKLPQTLLLAKKAGIPLQKVKGCMWQKKDGRLQPQEEFIADYDLLIKKLNLLKEDLPLADFLDQYFPGKKCEELRFSVRNYVEGYYAADPSGASSFALREELTTDEKVDYGLEGGYQLLIDYLEKCCLEKDVQFYFTQAVKKITWQKNVVEIETAQHKLFAQKVLMTVSIGVLQQRVITFLPALPAITKAASQLGFGSVVKLNYLFKEAFWKKENNGGNESMGTMNFLFSEEKIPTWWTKYPETDPVLTGWLAGPTALDFKDVSEESLVAEGLLSLAKIFSVPIEKLQQLLLAAKAYNWMNDPHFCGAYSYDVVDGDALKSELLQGVDETIYFAGEGLYSGAAIGTVEAALVSGREVAHQIVASF